MERDERVFARTLFRNKIFSSDGQAFEDLFVDVMQRGNNDFVSVKPQGTIGDRKNDGYDKKRGCYYQVFAPENPRLREQQAVSKLKRDFRGLKAYWDTVTPVQEFHFVFNDKYNGSFPTIETNLSKIKVSHKLRHCTCFLSKHLEEQLFGLEDDHILSVVGYLPSLTQVRRLDYSVLHEVIGHILGYEEKKGSKTKLNPPDFTKKIKFNSLGKQASAYLNAASYRVGILEKYFAANTGFVKQELRDTFNEMYKKAKKKKFRALAGSSREDLIFTHILETSSPKNTIPVREAVLVLMAYFFESCDIFEDPR